MTMSPLMQAPKGRHFGDVIITRSRQKGHCFCLGLDPHLSMIPAAFRRGEMAARSGETIAAIEDFLEAVLAIAADKVVAVKPQSAFYERLGSGGVALLERVCARARELGLPVLLDAKRGDIAATAEAYAAAYLDPESPNPADALTVNPYMGLDTLTPFLDRARAHGKGVIVLVKTSNPGSGDFQDLAVGEAPLFGRVAEALAPLAEALRGSETGWSALGVVTGVTYPEQAALIRRALPNALFLLPGFGYQKGDISQLKAALVPGPQGLEGGLINSARGTLFPPSAAEAGLAEWRTAFAAQLEAHIGDVRAALAT